MFRSSIVAISMLVLALPGCRQEPPSAPEDAYPSEPMTDEDPIDGDPAAIEREEIGENYMDNAKVVEPGPAETEVQTGASFEQPDGLAKSTLPSTSASTSTGSTPHSRPAPAPR